MKANYDSMEVAEIAKNYYNLLTGITCIEARGSSDPALSRVIKLALEAQNFFEKFEDDTELRDNLDIGKLEETLFRKIK